MIRKEKGKFVLYSSDGSKVLGTHPTAEKARAQEAAIEIAKKRRAKGK